MNILKEYIREIVRQTLHEIAPGPGEPDLPDIPTASGRGAIADTNANRIDQARVQFATVAMQYITAYKNQLTQLQYFNQPVVNNLFSVIDQLTEELNSDTSNWTNVPQQIAREMGALRPESNTALSILRSNTEWAHTGAAINQEELKRKYAEVMRTIPLVLAALNRYKAYYQTAAKG